MSTKILHEPWLNNTENKTTEYEPQHPFIRIVEKAKTVFNQSLDSFKRSSTHLFCFSLPTLGVEIFIYSGSGDRVIQDLDTLFKNQLQTDIKESFTSNYPPNEKAKPAKERVYLSIDDGSGLLEFTDPKREEIQIFSNDQYWRFTLVRLKKEITEYRWLQINWALGRLEDVEEARIFQLASAEKKTTADSDGGC